LDDKGVFTCHSPERASLFCGTKIIIGEATYCKDFGPMIFFQNSTSEQDNVVEILTNILLFKKSWHNGSVANRRGDQLSQSLKCKLVRLSRLLT